MKLEAIRDRLRALAAHWDGPRSLLVRSFAALGVALVATRGYALFLGKIYPVRDWLFWRIASLWGWGILLSLACVSFGHLLLTRAFRVVDRPPLESIVTSAALGLVAFVLGMYVGGALHLFNAPFAVLLPAAMLAAGVRPLVAWLRALRAEAEASPPPARAPLDHAITALAWIFGLFAVAVIYLQVMTPVSINFDSTWSHIPIAVDYARAGKIVRFDADYTRNVPHLASIVHTWAMIVPPGLLNQPALRWMLCQHLEYFFFLWTLAGVAAMTRWLVDDDRRRGTWAAFFLFPAIFVYDSNLGGGADHYLAFFAPPLFLAAGRAMRSFEPRACALVGVFAGGALLTKYQAVYLMFGVALILGGAWLFNVARRLFTLVAALVSKRKSAPSAAPAELTKPSDGEAMSGPDTNAPADPSSDDEAASDPAPEAPSPPSWEHLVMGVLAAVAAFAVVSSPHFLKNWAFYSNPVYPFALDIFKKSHPTTPNAAFLFEWLFKDYAWRPHGTFRENVKDALELCFHFSFKPHYSFTKDVPNTGSLFTLCLPLVLLVRSPGRIWLGIVAGMSAVFLWAMTFQVDRHLQTFIPLLAATTAAIVIKAWDLGWAARAGVVPLVLCQAIWGGDAMFYWGHANIHTAMDMIRGGYEGKRENRFAFRAEAVSIGNALPKDARVLLHNYRPNLGINREILLDWPGQQGLILYEGIRGPRMLYDYWRALGVTHLLYPPGHRPTQTKQDDILFTEFVSHYGQDRRHYGGFELVTLPSKPPPPDHPYKVLSIGLYGYRDGLYGVEAMKAYEGIPAEKRPRFPGPEKAMPKEPAAQKELAALADAVGLAARAKPDPLLKSYIDANFLVAQVYARSFSIHLRKGQPVSSVPRAGDPSAPSGVRNLPKEEEPGAPLEGEP